MILEEETYSLYHGFRTKKKQSDIDQLITFTNDQAYDEIVKALEYHSLGRFIDAKRTSKASTVNLIQGMISESKREKRFGFIYTCPFIDRAERWAIRNPEIIFITLSHADLPINKILEYLKTRFGNPHIAKLKLTITSKFPSAVIPMNREIPRQDIEWIRPVEGDEENILAMRMR